METVKLSPRGYCHGVVNAVNTISNLVEKSTEKNITILGMVIHNKQIVSYFENEGIKTLSSESKSRLELLDEIDDGIVVFTAHGVSPKVRQKALDKGLEIIDTTCDDVLKSQNLIIKLLQKEYEIIYIGKHNHPESEAARGIDDKVHVVETIEEVISLKINSKKIAVTNQTTMSLYDIYNITEEIKKIYPNIYFVDEVCNATRIRQEAIKNQSKTIEHCFIVGDKLSNNSRKLTEVSINEAHIPATLIENIEDINIEMLKQFKKVSVSSGASTPTKTTNEVIKFLQNFDKNNPLTFNNKSNLSINNIITKKTL